MKVSLDKLTEYKTYTLNLLSKENLPTSMVDDVVQSAILDYLELQIEASDQEADYYIYDRIEANITKLFERGYKVTMWQDSANDLYSRELWGDNTDFD